MPIEGIRSRTSPLDWSMYVTPEAASLAPPRKVPAPQGISEAFKKDSVEASNKDAWEQLFPQLAGALMPHPSAAHHLDTRPLLEAPQFDVKKLPAVQAELASLMPKVLEEDPSASLHQKDQNQAEIVLILLFLTCMKTQREHEETNISLTNATLQQRQEVNTRLRKEIIEELGKLNSKKGFSNILKWVGYVFWGGLATAGVASLALTAVTAGTTLPLTLTVAAALINAGLAVGSGGTQIFKGILDYQNNKTVGKLEEQRFERHLNGNKMHEGINQMKQSANVVAENWKDARELYYNLYRTSLLR